MNESRSELLQASGDIIPTIVKITEEFFDENWDIYFDQQYLDLLCDAGKLSNLLQNKITAILTGAQNSLLRESIDVAGVYASLAIFQEKKEIRFYSTHLGSELFLLQELTKTNHPVLKTPEAQNFKLHAEKAAAVDLSQFPSVIEQVTEIGEMVDFLKDDEYDQLEPAIKNVLKKLLFHLNSYKPGIFERVSDYSLGLTAKYALIRIHLLKFLAILPSLDEDKAGVEVKRILLESLRRLIDDSVKARFLGRKGEQRPIPLWLENIFSLVHFLSQWIPSLLLAWLVRTSVKMMARRFIAGEKIEEASGVFGKLSKTKRDATLDQLGELVVSEKEADRYRDEVIKLIKGLGAHYQVGGRNKAGILRSHVSIKVSALCSDFRPEAFDYTFALVAPRLRTILLTAKKHRVFLNIDAEHYDYRDLVFEIYKKVLLETKELAGFSDTGIVLQGYLRDAYKHFEEILALAKEREIRMPVRLVKGAYWDAETIHADAHSYDAPEFLNKEETDLHFRQLIIKILEHGEDMQLCLAGHNFTDHAFAEVARKKHFPTAPVIEHQCLHMTYEALSTALAQMGWATRNYVPVGSLLVGMAYLVRRIMENSSQVGVLTIMRSHKKVSKIRTPKDVHLSKKSNGELQRDRSQQVLTHEFFPVPPVRLYVQEHLDAVQKSLENICLKGAPEKRENPFPVSGDWVSIFSNSDPSIKAGEIKFSTDDDVMTAVERAKNAYEKSSWTKRPWIERSAILLRAANEMLVRRLELSCKIVKESGKTMIEALGDVDEAIDFLNFYARQQGDFVKKNPGLHSRGVLAIVTPWNFPLAIPCGMVSAALVSGNAVILKSAEQTPLIADEMVEVFHRAGVDRDILIHLPGLGETVGQALVAHEDIAGVIFTGSKSVGMKIAHEVGTRVITNPVYGGSYPAKVVTEMGGKNAIIVTANAELDETVAGILYSSFAHAGQKCSAASRVIVHESILNKLAQRLSQAINDLQVGKSWDLATFVNPVISKEDQDRLRQQVKEAIQEANEYGGRVWVDRSCEDLPGYCVGPVLIQLPAVRCRAQESFSQRELFGPVIHLIGFSNLEQSVELFNQTNYALTGGVFGQSQDDIDYLTKHMECGNLYVNRSITGARVGIEPFGGFKLSGTGPKAGSFNYLEAFHVNPVSMPVLESLARLGSEDQLNESQEVTLAEPSKLTPKGRLPRVDRGLDCFIHNYEFLYQGIYGENKQLLTDFRYWLSKELVDFKRKEYSNVEIPGQLSFNNYLLNSSQLMVVAYEPRAYLCSLMQVVSALAVGTGVSVVCRNDDSFCWWSKVQAHFIQAGISAKNFHVQQVSAPALKSILESHQITYILVDGKLQQYQEISQLIFNHEYSEQEMIKLMTPFDGPDLRDFSRFLQIFSLPRSFAINTMRHGAPLELDIS